MSDGIAEDSCCVLVALLLVRRAISPAWNQLGAFSSLQQSCMRPSNLSAQSLL